MNKCLKITLTVDHKESSLTSLVQAKARTCDLEGVVQSVNGSQLRIIVCGTKENVDAFIELLQKEPIQDVEIEPFVKDKDYRGVFRVIE
jgi:acylphosphatase